ncbi:metallopeptidase family protein [Candidatus Odyssella thessalonicensis]|uniref:metallopeptidase family protein n=1 Tax=Candidatus Odyssella thessalonicensis TaxID=84647 RepID=UPI000225BAFB|nr:metallopeptidase family protein [Candidatus Odyssella thessalonicensis]
MAGKKVKLSIISRRNETAEMPDLADLYTMAYKTLASLPEKYKPFVKNLLVRVENFADDETVKSLNLNDKYDLLGLYRGVPLPLKATPARGNLPDIIYLYRCPLIKYANENNEKVDQIVYHVMIHEIGHHFGYSDNDLDWLQKLDDGGRNRD